MPKPIADLNFFTVLKAVTEKYWSSLDIDDAMYGLQIQTGTKWCTGLSDGEMNLFEKQMQLQFPPVLRYYYQTMNGLTLPGIDVFAEDGTAPVYHSYFYTYPDCIPVMQQAIRSAYATHGLEPATLQQQGISRLFPIAYEHFLLPDIPGCPVVSIKGNSVLYCSDSFCKFLVTECLGDELENVADYENEEMPVVIPFWIKLPDIAF